MSLVSLNSNGQQPSFFSCHFPQPIHLKPFSQVCLLKFLHFRDTHVYNITTANNTLLFCIGNTQFDGIRQVRIPVGEYSGDDLASAIQTQMNAVLQQQHYEWTCSFTPEDDTTSPPTKESFQISYASLPTPAEVAVPVGDMNQLEDLLSLSTNKVSVSAAGELEVDGTLKPALVMVMPKGVLTNDGSVSMDNLRLSPQNFDETTPFADTNFVFDARTLGMCRTELASRVNDNPNLEFNDRLQDVSIQAGANGIQISSLKISGSTKVGSPNYATEKPCRLLPSSAFKTLAQTGLSLSASQLPMLRFRFKYTTLGSSRRVVCQLEYEVADGSGAGYASVPSGSMGNDPQGNPYATDHTIGATTFAGCVWVSDADAFNDVVPNPSGGTTSSKVQNVMITKKAPFLPTYTPLELPSRIGAPDLTQAGVSYQDALGNDATFSDYTGSNGYQYELNIDDGSGNVYYLKEQVHEETDPLKFKLQLTDIPLSGNGEAVFDLQNGQITLTNPDSSAGGVLSLKGGSTFPQITIIQNTPIGFRTILNPNLRPLSLLNVADGSPHLSTDEVVQQFYAEQPDVDQSLDNGTLVGADLSRRVILFLRQLNTADIATNSGAPANLRSGQASGTIGSTIGSVQNIIIPTTSTGKQVFTSGQSTQRVAKDTILTISIPELAGVKSFNGIDQGAGKNLSGEAKHIAILPREEFETRGESTNGSLVYVSPFENWIDINNGGDVYLNELTCEVRQPAGQLAIDLKPDTICQIKFREDPQRMAERKADERFEGLALAMSSAVQTGQILSQKIYQTGS